jgi:hypothetical protein
VVLGRSSNHRRSADVYLLDQFVIRNAGLLGGRREGIEIDDHQIERVDGGGGELLAVGCQPPIGQDPAVDPRMERLDAPIEHLREAGDRGHVRHRQARGSKRPSRTAGGNELEAEAHQARPELREAGLVGDREERSPWDGHRLRRSGGIDPDRSTVRLDCQRAGKGQADGSRQEPVLDRVYTVEERFLRVAG